MSHAFLINCHADVAECECLIRVLARYAPESSIDVYYDGQGGGIGDFARKRLHEAGAKSIIQAPYQPDKCWSILRAVSRLVETSKADTATFLHSDIVPTDWAQFRRFIERFAASGKWITWCPMLPHHVGVNFCTLNFNVKAAQRYFPITIPEKEVNPKEWFNDIQFTRHLDRVNLLWREDSYKMGGIVQPFTGCFRNANGDKLAKSWHTPDYEFWVHDFFPESSVIHSDSPTFWERYHEIART